MASNTLLAGELARRNKNAEAHGVAPSAQNGDRELDVTAINNNTSSSDWKTNPYQSCNQKPQFFEEQIPKLMTGIAEYQNEHFVSNLQSLVGVMGSSTQGVNVSDNLNIAQGLNPLSLVPGLSNSGEVNSDKADISVLFSKTQRKLIGATLNSWMPPPQPRPGLPLPSMPMFAAWTDT